MPIIDNRAPPTLQHDCTMFGHVGPCRACITDAPRQAAQAASAAHPMRNVEVSPFAPRNAPGARTAAPTMGAYSSAALEAKDRDVRQVHTDAGQGPCPHPHCVSNGLGGNMAPQREVSGLGFASGHTEHTFTRAEVLAVLKSRKTILEERLYFAEAVRELDALISVFERME